MQSRKSLSSSHLSYDGWLSYSHNLFLLIKNSLSIQRTVNYILHTFSFEILLPHIVVIPPEFDIKISAIDVKLWMSSRI